MKWKKEPGSAVQAPISHGGSSHDYVISHRRDQHTVSYRPAGQHVHVGTFATEKEAKAAAAAHAKTPRTARVKPSAPSTSPPPRSARKKSPAQLNRDIAASLSSRGQPTLAAIFASPEARGAFVREMRHEIQTQQTAAVSAAHRAARPFTVKHVEQIGDRRVRSIVGNYATEDEARARADQLGGWVETRDGRVIYGVEG